MASRNMQINLQFNANVQNARAQLQGLQTQLNNLINSNTTSTSLGITPQIQEATRSAMDLKIALNNAMNVNTGKLNLNKFQSELNRMGKDIGYFAQQMGRLGPEGVKTFTQVASAVAQADTKLFSLQGGMKKLANTFMNTMRWQITSQAIMAVTSAISETVSYAKELDTSLNNIRIVTGKSADQMATFAKQANNAAKALSTSTTKYTDASLIYYQQGLNDKAVKERTDVTVKLANVVGESAETVSEWMTAIWNNFDDGSEKLEYYADVLAKLGAATASSADEIAGGLEKFAAVAETIGLSYEYAASALATITAETRQSEDVVGTALKTILSRMEQLKQGDTLEDGTTLGQYSLALQKVGVDIKDASGELKDMDIILEQTGTRWETLGRDQQIALAQQVAGIRQYTQFMALMDNWDVMEKNLELTEQANGALTEQQRIYEESTKAAEERMKVASEAIKTTLLGGDDLTDLYNFGAGALEVINELLEAFGGLPTILLAVAAALTKVYQPQLASFLSQAALAGKDLGMSMLHPVKAMKGELVTSGQQTRLDTLGEAKKLALQNSPSGSASLIQSEFDAREKLVKVEKQLNASVQQRAQWELETLETQKEQVLQLSEQAELQRQAGEQAYARVASTFDKDSILATEAANAVQAQADAQGAVQSHLGMAHGLAKQGQKIENSMDAQGRAQMGDALLKQIQAIEKQSQNLGVALNDIKGFENLTEDVNKFASDANISLQQIIDKIETVQGELAGGVASKGVIESEVDKSIQSSRDSRSVVESIDNLQNIQEPTSKATSQATLGEIDKNLGNIKESKITSKQAKAKIDSWKRESEAIKNTSKSAKEYTARTQALVRDIKKHTNIQDKNTKTLRGTYNANKRLSKSESELTKIRKDKRKMLTDEHKEMVKGAEAAETQETMVKELGDQYDEFGEKLDNGGAGFKHWSDSLSSGISHIATYAMGVSMLTSSFDNLFSAIGRGDATWKDWVSSISSAMMSLTMLMPVITQVITSAGNMVKVKQQEKIAQDAVTAATAAGVAQDQASIIVDKLQHGASEQEINDEYGEAGAKVINALAENSKNAGKGPVGWAMFAAGLAMILPVAAMVGISAIGGAKSGAKEAKQEEVSKGTESLEAINENQELASSVTELTEEYNALRSAGESTADVLEDMREKIPELIDSYKELAKTMGTHIDTSELEKAYEVFEKTGDTSLLEKAQEKLDKDIKSKEKTIAQSTIDNASDLVMDAAFEGQGHKDGKSYTYHMGDVGLSDEKEKQVQNIFAEELNDLWKKDSDGAGGQFTISDYENEGELIDAYNKMLAARDRLIEAGLDDTNYYKELNGEIKQMAESMPDLINAQQQLFDIQKEEALKDEQAFNSKIGLGSIGSIEEFEANKDKLIAKIQEETEWTKAQAEAYLMATEAYGGYAEAADFFSENGLGFNKDASEQTIKDIKEWFADLPEEDRTLAMTIDYTTVATKEDAAAALDKARKKAEEAAILQEAEKLEVDKGTFDTYTEGLADLNKELDENENLTKQIALNNLKISKGLTTLTKSWDDNFEIIKRGNKASLEYAEAIGEVKKAFEEMFGVKPSTEYIEQYSNEINEMANGNLDSLQKLQDALAEDYIINMEFSTAINENWSGTIADAQAQLRGLLDDIDTSVEIGKESTLSSDFLDSVQGMLDAGVIAEEQLESLFRAKGYELNITGWKKIPGPVKKITQTTYDPNDLDNKTTKIIEEQEDINVPIINGKAPEGASGPAPSSVATVTKSTDKRVIDTSAAEEKADKAKERRKKLEDELDRYHEINEIIADTERELDKLGKAKDRAFGANKLALMDKEIAKQKELIENNKKLLEEAEKYYQQDRSKLLSNWDVQLDSVGRISNYEEIQQRYIDRLKANAGNEKLYEDIEEEYEAFKDAAEKYEESLNKVEEQAEKVNDELDVLYERNLEKIEYKVQIKVDIADDDKAYLDFLMQKVEDDAFAAAEAIGYLGKEAVLTLDKIKTNEEGIADVQRALAAGEITPEQAVEKMREYRDNLVDLNADLLEIRQTVQDKLTEAFEGWNEEIERGITKLEHYGTVLENYKNVIDIVGKDMLGLSDETMAKLSKAQISNANDIIRSTKAQLEANNSALARMRQAREDAVARGDSESVKEWDEQIKIAEDKSQELTTTLQEALSNGLQLAVDDFALSVDQIADSFSKAVSGIYDDIEDMRDGWDRMQEVADRYLETYEKTYEISKLNRKIQDSIDKTDNIASQKELRDLQDEMYEMTKDGQQLSKYDLEYLQKKYDLLVAEQALKDAQNAKSVVRLQRDSEGNFGYVYTADQNSINDAEQRYEDSLYQYQDFIHNMDKELTDFFISTQEKMDEEIRAAAEKYGYGTEEFIKEVDKIEAKYKEDMEYITSEYGKMTDRNIGINNRFNANVAETYNSTFLGKIQPDYETFEGLYNSTTLKCQEASGLLEQAVINLRNTFEYQFGLAGEDFNNFAGEANEKFGNIQNDSSNTADSVEGMANRMEDDINNRVIPAVEDFQITYSNQMEAIRTATDLTIQKVNALIQEYLKLAEAANKDYTPPDNSGSGTYVNTIDNEGSKNNPKNEDTKNADLNDSIWWYKSTKTENGKNYIGASDSKDSKEIEWFEVTGKSSTGKKGENDLWEKAKNARGTFSFDESELSKNQAKLNGTYQLGAASNTLGGSLMYRKTYKKNEDGRTFSISKNGLASATNYSNAKITGYYKGTTIIDGDKTHIINLEQSGGDFVRLNFTDLNQLFGNKWSNWTAFVEEMEKHNVPAYSFDTGGYTGAWGPEGRLAMLHQKEIVLNAHDTENFLAAIGIVRDISDQIEKNAIVMQYQNQLANYRASVGNSGETLQQEVHITAEFPNATDHNEIEEAFKNLTNLASQYANRKF